MKKWAARISTLFIQRYGNPRYTANENIPFANYFRDNVSTQLLASVLNCLAAKSNGKFLTDDVHRMCLIYTSNSIEMAPTYKMIKPHLDFLLFNVITPTLCLSEEDISLFDEDPIEFVRKVNDPSEDWLTPRKAAITLLQSLARYRKKDVLPKLLAYFDQSLKEYNLAPHGNNKDYKKKDGILVAMATISKVKNLNNYYLNIIFSLHKLL